MSGYFMTTVNGKEPIAEKDIAEIIEMYGEKFIIHETKYNPYYRVTEARSGFSPSRALRCSRLDLLHKRATELLEEKGEQLTKQAIEWAVSSEGQKLVLGAR